MPNCTIVWFRNDLRLQDNPALDAAIKLGNPVIPIFIHAPEEEKPWIPGAASDWWLHHALQSLNDALAQHKSQLTILQGDTKETLQTLIKKTNASALFWNRRYEPAIIKRDAAIKKHFTSEDIDTQSFNAALLYEPHTIKNKSGQPFKVFTPYWKHCITHDPRQPIKVPLKNLSSPESFPKSSKLDLLPKIHWDKDFYNAWDPTLEGAQKRLKSFNKNILENYKEGRNIPSEDGTSRLSPYLHFGQISPHQIYHSAPKTRATATYLSEIGWREFAHHLLYHFPDTPTKPFKANFKSFPWQKSPKALKAWQQGMTGYPIVDAGMRQLWQTGWMHNRVRMIVASFLTKDLMIPWLDGAKWFWDTLVDADLASNSLGWQWTAGSGADASPYFRVFNPMTQGAKFDPDGNYVKEYIPELAKLPAKYIHAPWEAPEGVLIHAGIELGSTYPKPMVDHAKARVQALNAYEKMKTFAAKD